MAHDPKEPGKCWGQMFRKGWDGVKSPLMWVCDKKPRAGCLTCHWHREQENQAQRLKRRRDTNEENQ